MASRLLSLAQIIAARAAITKTSATPNAWAAIATWRRFFEMKKEEEEDSIEEIGQILEEEMDIRSVRPVAAAEVEEARMQFSREYFQNIVRQVAPTRGVTTPSQAVVEQPNLQVPVGEEYLYLAQ